MQTSAEINEIAAALAKAQGEMTNPTKESINPHFRSKYADLASGLNAVRTALAKNEICVVQSTHMEGNLVMLTTQLIHASGQWFGSDYPVCTLPAPQQQIGSALTFSRRYSLFALAGIAPEDDDDGNAASVAQTQPSDNRRREASPRPAEPDYGPPFDNEARDPIDTDDFPGDKPSPTISVYIGKFTEKLAACKNATQVRPLWNAEKGAREFLGIPDGSHIWTELRELWVERGKELAAASVSGG